MIKLLPVLALGLIPVCALSAPRQLLSVTEEGSGYKSTTSFEYDAQSRISKITDGESVYTFDYSKVNEGKFIMTRTDNDDVIVTDMDLNSDGLVVKAVEIEDGVADDDYFTFEYTNGYLTNYKQVRPDEVEESIITYTDGVITKIVNTDGNPNENEVVTFEYSDALNVGELYYYDELFGLDVDDFEYVAMAGLMGKAPAKLPVKTTQTGNYGSESETFTWTYDLYNYPVKYIDNDNGYEYVVSLEWSDASGVENIVVNENGESAYFTLDGIAADENVKGFVIERRKDGSVVKVIRK